LVVTGVLATKEPPIPTPDVGNANTLVDIELPFDLIADIADRHTSSHDGYSYREKVMSGAK